MKHFLYVLMLAFACRVAFATELFIPGTEDIPAMTSMTFTDDSVSFDVPEGQILIVAAETSSSKKKIYDFYTETLAELGWSYKGNGQFKRDLDSLELTVEPMQNKNIVHFNLMIANN